MWTLFAATAALATALLLIPGYLTFRTAGATHVVALASAPSLAVGAYCMLGLAYAKLEIEASLVSVAGVVTTIAAVAFLGVTIVRRRRTRACSIPNNATSSSCATTQEATPAESVFGESTTRRWMPLLYVTAGIIATSCLYLSCMVSPESPAFSNDNVFHYGQIRSFATSGVWSSIGMTLYPEGPGQDFSPFESGSFYPAGWHTLAAMAASALDTPAPLAAHATNFAFAAIVFPLGMCLLMTALFPGNARVQALGALCSVAFSAFPWTLLEVWEIYSNFASYTLLPALAGCFIVGISADANVRTRAIAGAGFALGLVGCLFLQPNVAFSAGVLLAPFCLTRISQAVDAHWAKSPRKARRARKALLCGAFVLLAVTLWAAFYRSSFMSAVVAWFWKPVADVPTAVIDALTFAFAEPQPQLILSVLTLIGIARALHQRKNIWLIASFALACFIYVVAASQDDTLFKHVVAGFWYTDYYRIAPLATLCAMPLAAQGLAAVTSVVQNGMEHGVSRLLAHKEKATVEPRSGASETSNSLSHACETGAARRIGIGASALCLALIAAAIFRPGYFDANGTYHDSAFARVKGMAQAHMNDSDSNPYGADKRAFVAQVKNIVGTDVVLNLPYDGSLYAFGTDELNVYQRYISGYGDGGESTDSKIVRQTLDGYAANDLTRGAIQRIGAEYVLVLDHNEKAMRGWFYWYRPELWTGMTSITDDTPGFEVVLAQDDMRLYRLTALESDTATPVEALASA